MLTLVSFCDAKFGITFKHYAKIEVNGENEHPLYKFLKEQKGLITRQRDDKDERVLIVSITREGDELKDKAVEIPVKMAGCVGLEPQDAAELYRLLHKLLAGFEQ